jgi:hypothetical protein
MDTAHMPLDDINGSHSDSVNSSGDRFRKDSNERRLSSVVGYKAAPMNSQAVLSAMRRGGIDVKGGKFSSRQIERKSHDIPTSRSAILMGDVYDDAYPDEVGESDDGNSEEQEDIYMDVNDEDEGVDLDINNDDDEDKDNDEDIAADDDDIGMFVKYLY